MFNIISIVTDKKKKMNVRIVFKGDLFCSCIHKEDEPLIEFYFADTIPPSYRKDQELGYLCSRYYYSTLSKGNDGLCLIGSDRDFDINSDLMNLIRQWAKRLVENEN